MTNLEKIARAMCVDGGLDPDETVANDGLRWRYYAPLARTALTTLRTPSPEMAEAMRLAIFQVALYEGAFSTPTTLDQQLAAAFTAAIDAALKEKGNDHN